MERTSSSLRRNDFGDHPSNCCEYFLTASSPLVRTSAMTDATVSTTAGLLVRCVGSPAAGLRTNDMMASSFKLHGKHLFAVDVPCLRSKELSRVGLVL